MNFIKQELELLKKNTDNMSNQQKFNHIYYYYKFHFIFVVIMVVFIGNLVQTIATQKDTNFYGIFINVSANETQRNYLSDLYAQTFDVNPKTEAIILDETLFSTTDTTQKLDIVDQEKLIALMLTGTADVISAEEETFYYLAYSDLFYDLRNCLSDAEIEMYAPYFCYIDQAILDSMSVTINENPSAELIIDTYPTTIDDMTNPIPVGILVRNNTNLSKAYQFQGTGIVGIPLTTERLENTKNFLSVALNP